MENNLPTEYKKSIFTKVCNFLKNIFRKEKNEEKVVIEVIENKETFLNNIKVEENNEKNYIKNMDKHQFIKQFERNPELLNSLSIPQLRKLKKYYQDIILEYKEKLKKIS